MSTPSLIPLVPGASQAKGTASSDKERALLALARSGDLEALRILWDDYRRPVQRYFASSITSREEVEDLTSDTMLAIFNGISRFRGVSSNSPTSRDQAVAFGSDTDIAADRPQATFGGFVHSIARNQLRQWIRRKGVRDHSPTVSSSRSGTRVRELDCDWSDKLAVDSDADPLNRILRQEHLDSACFALAEVGMRSSEQFKALVFHYGCGLAHKDIALLLDTRKETINARLQDGRDTLKAHYAARPRRRLRAAV